MRKVNELRFSGEVSRTKDYGEAVASVIALMLLLAVIATFICLYSTEYLPGLKEQSEIAQVTEVKEAFMDFSNDIDHIVSDKKGASYGHTIPLGAGDVIMSPEKSSGTLRVTDLDAIVNITATGAGINPVPETPDASAGMVKVEYKPSYSFWEGQGYNWQYGYINVTKDDVVEVPMLYYTIDDDKFSNELSAFAESFIEFDPVGDASSGELDSLTIRMANITAGETSFISGNSATSLKIYSDQDSNKKEYIDPCLTFWIVNSTSTSRVYGSESMPEFSEILFDKIEGRLNYLNETYWNDIPEPAILIDQNGYDAIDIDMSTYGSGQSEVVIQSVDISVSTS
jgi:hypothetical protein